MDTAESGEHSQYETKIMTIHEREIKTLTMKRRENALLKICFDVHGQ